MKNNRRKIDVGDRVNNWTIVEYPYASNKVLARCDCGAESWKYLTNIRNGKSRTCWECRKTDPWLLTMNSVKSTAKRRGIEWSLTLQEWKKIALSSCHYCGREPSNMITGFGVKYNGIDRKDSNGSYTAENSIPACKVCNRAKSNMTYEKFIEWMRDIATSKILQQ